MPTQIWLRDKHIINTDPQRRCYNGCNYTEKIEYDEWRLFQTWNSQNFVERVAKTLRCDWYDIRLKEI